MAEQLLDRPQVGAALEQVRRERMAQAVRVGEQAPERARIEPAAADGVSTLVVTGIPWRTGWRYAERGYRHLYWDSGTMLSQLLALAATGPRRHSESWSRSRR